MSSTTSTARHIHRMSWGQQAYESSRVPTSIGWAEATRLRHWPELVRLAMRRKTAPIWSAARYATSSLAGFPTISTLSRRKTSRACLLYTSDAADDLRCVDLGG